MSAKDSHGHPFLIGLVSRRFEEGWQDGRCGSDRSDGHTAAALRGLATKSRDVAQRRRLLALAMVLDGGSRLEAVRQAGMDRQTLRDWVYRYNDLGVDGLLSRLPPGPAPKLTEAQMAELRKLVVDGPNPDKHGVVRWRCLDLRAEVSRRFSVTVDERTIGKWLRALGLRGCSPAFIIPSATWRRRRLLKKTSAVC